MLKRDALSKFGIYVYGLSSATVGVSLIFADAIASRRKQVEDQIQNRQELSAASGVTSQMDLS